MRRGLILFAVFALMSMLLAACGAQVTAQEIVQKMRETAASAEDAHVVVSGSVAVTDAAATGVQGAEKLANMNGQVTVELWFKKPNLMRVEVRSSSDERIDGVVLVHDGQSFWAYQPGKKIAYKVQAEAIRGLSAQANIPADLQDLLENPNLEDAVDRILALTDYTLLGEEQVGAWNTYKLELKPKADNSVAAAALAGARGTIWVDKQTWAIVKAEGSAPQGNGALEVETLELNSGLAESVFQFTLPQGGHVLDLSGMVPRSMTIAEARDAAQAEGWKLLEPGYLPQGATLVQVMGSKGLMGRASTYVLSYSGGASTPTFWITQVKGAGVADLQKEAGSDRWTGKEVVVNGKAARLASDPEGKMRAVFWQDPKSGVTVAVGGQIDEVELLKVAEGVR